MSQSHICIDCGRTVDVVKRARCAACWPAAAAMFKSRKKPSSTGAQSAKRSAYYSITKTNRWKKLSQQIRLRDGACVHCGSRSDLTVHHIAPVLAAPDLAYDPNNLITLCRSCHVREEKRVA